MPAYTQAELEELKEQAEKVNTQIQIQKIFDDFIVPEMGGYFDNFPVDFDASPRACCPLHSEDTPSFRYYRDTNTFHCFGCKKTGNVVKLFQEYNNINKDTNIGYYRAASILYKKYFLNKENAGAGLGRKEKKINFVVPDSSNLKVKEVNSTVDLIRLNSYKNKLENIIDTSQLSLEAKKKLWKELDTIEVILEKSEEPVSAIDIIKYLKGLIAEAEEKENLKLNFT